METTRERRPFSFSDLLALLIVVLSMLTAYAAFKDGQADSNSTDYFFQAQSLLTDANSLYLEANQFVLYDYELYDSYIINQDVDDFAADYYYDQLSGAALDSLERPDGPFDETYYDLMYADADATINQADANFEQAKQQGERANGYQLALLVLSVGLAFTAWASLAEASSRMRYLFAGLSGLALLLGVVQLLLLG